MVTTEITYNNNFFIITGGPGAGKTTLLHELKKQHFKCITEVARDIIKEQVNIGGDALPWGNKELYKQIMLDRSIESYTVAAKDNSEITFFDRGIPDTLSYAKLIGSDISDEMSFRAAHYRYNQKVFMLPPWLTIYHPDDERKQTWQEAVETYRVILATYKDYGYCIIEVPRTTIEKRIDFILENVQSV